MSVRGHVANWIAEAIARHNVEGTSSPEAQLLGKTADEVQTAMNAVLGPPEKSGSMWSQFVDVLKEDVAPVVAGYIAGGPLGAAAADVAVIGKIQSSHGNTDWGAALETIGSVVGQAAKSGGNTEVIVPSSGGTMSILDDIGGWLSGEQGIIPDSLETMIGQAGSGIVSGLLSGWLDGSPSSSGGNASATAQSSVPTYSTTDSFTGPTATPIAVNSGGQMVYQAAAGRRMVPFQQGVWPGPGYRLVNRRAFRGAPARAAGMYWVPRRMTNPLNPRALARASRRSDGFMNFVKKHFTFPGRVAKPKSPFRTRRRRGKK
jgi:hypothetical protein